MPAHLRCSIVSFALYSDGQVRRQGLCRASGPGVSPAWDFYQSWILTGREFQTAFHRPWILIGQEFQHCQVAYAYIVHRAEGPAQPLPLPSGTGRSARKNSKHRRRGTSSSLSKNFFAGWVLASCGAPSVLNCFICIVFRRTSPPARAVSDLRPRWLRVVNDLSRHQLQRLGRSLTLPPADMPSPLRSSCRFKKRRQNPAQRLLVESI